LHPYNPGRGNGGGTMSGGQEDRSEREQKDEKDIYAEKLEITVFFSYIHLCGVTSNVASDLQKANQRGIELNDTISLGAKFRFCEFVDLSDTT
jgi:hypothetical protein